MAARVSIMGNELIIKDNPSRRSKFFKGKGMILSRLPPWAFNLDALSLAQKRAVLAFARVASEAASKYPADGTIATLDARREYIAKELAGKTYEGKVAKVEVKGAERIKMLEARLGITA